ncbi:MAG: isochorismate synthase [Opitutae bacterium]
MSTLFQTAPTHCKVGDDLTDYLNSIIDKSILLGRNLYCSICYKTSFSDPLALLEKLHVPDQPHCYFEKATDDFSIACGQYLAHQEFSGPNRFLLAKDWSTELLNFVERAGDAPIAGSGPTIFLTAAFESEISDSCRSSLCVFLPKWQVVQQGGEHFIILNIKVTPTSIAVDMQKNLSFQLHAMMGLRKEKLSDQLPPTTHLGKSTENFLYEAGVSEALNSIHAGEVSKIVLARQLTFDLKSTLSSFAISHALRAKFPDCHAFSLCLPQQGTWVGASPETLARIRGLSLRTEALAGSAPRGHSAGKDAHWGKTILAREKEVREHKLVIDSIIRRLSSVGVSSLHEGLPRLLRLANLQHVRTPVQGKLPDGLHPFEVLASLHPTPAMGGTPRNPALSKLAEIEKSSRGLYSGVAGWMDAKGRSEFIVPIRCGRIQNKSLTLYAGAGIVDGSIPSNEKSETDWKLQAMLEVITGSPNLPS